MTASPQAMAQSRVDVARGHLGYKCTEVYLLRPWGADGGKDLMRLPRTACPPAGVMQLFQAQLILQVGCAGGWGQEWDVDTACINLPAFPASSGSTMADGTTKILL